MTGLKAQIKIYEELVQKQKEELHRVENEKEALTAKLTIWNAVRIKLRLHPQPLWNLGRTLLKSKPG